MTDLLIDRNIDDPADPQERMLRAKIEGLKEEIVKSLALLVAHPDTPEFFKNDPVIKELAR